MQDHVENEWKDEVDERGDEAIQQVEICPRMPRVAFLFGQNRRVRYTRRRESERQGTQREKEKWIKLGHLADYDWLLGFLSS